MLKQVEWEMLSTCYYTLQIDFFPILIRKKMIIKTDKKLLHDSIFKISVKSASEVSENV